MSLVAWLPLINDLKNQGRSDLIFTGMSSGSNTQKTADGKLGNCYTNNSHTAGGLVSNIPIYLGKNQSMFCWFRFTDLMSAASLGAGLVSQHRYPTNSGMGITIRYVSATTGYLSVCTGNGSSRTYNTYCGTTLLQAGTWYHGGYTYDGSKLKIYVNGVCENTVSISDMYVPADYLCIYCWAFEGTTVGSGNTLNHNYQLIGSLNDVRIYDHCLSQKEISMLNMSMVAHYPLNNNGAGNTNLAVGTNNRDISVNVFDYIEQTGGITRTSEIIDKRPVIKLTRNSTAHSGWDALLYRRIYASAIKTNTDYTISMDIKASMNGTINIYGFNNSDATNGMCNSTTAIKNNFKANEWTHLVYRVHTLNSFDNITVGSQCVYFTCAEMRQTGVSIAMRNLKVEEGTKDTAWCPNPIDTLYKRLGYNNLKEYDVSGYKYHGSYGAASSNVVAYNAESPRYSAATIFDGVTDCINIPLYDMLKGSTAEWSFSVWFYKSQLGSKSYQTILSGGFEFDTRSSNDAVIWLYSWGSGKWAYEFNKWYHIVFVRTASDSKLYVNGELALTGSAGSTVSSSKTAYIGSWHSLTSQNFDGRLSDFRIFSKALSANEIKELYNSYGHISNNGILFAYDFKEN